jgi:alkanesulfonate monooxygenase SsuD/methylene tetrahydromethanopterin reductase-like flavin-dependent oxidoreductase (luciferase family)
MTQSITEREMKLGLILPNDEAAVNGQTLRFRELRDLAQFAEQVGFDSLWMPDHLISRFPGKYHIKCACLLENVGSVWRDGL